LGERTWKDDWWPFSQWCHRNQQYLNSETDISVSLLGHVSN
jgi:hypothetical protein